MLILPDEIMALLTPFKQLFSRRIWDLVQVLVVGALLAPGKRTVSAVLEVMGLKEERQFQNYHRVLNRAKWSSLAVEAEVVPSAGCCWGCWWRRLSRRGRRWWWGRTRRWSGAGGRR